MPSWLQPIAEHNPFTILTDACRALYNGYDPGNDAWIALAWAVGITIVFAILATPQVRPLDERLTRKPEWALRRGPTRGWLRDRSLRPWRASGSLRCSR